MDAESDIIDFLYKHKALLLDTTDRGQPALELLGFGLLSFFPHLFIPKKMLTSSSLEAQKINNYYKMFCGGVVLQIMIEEGYHWLAKDKKTKKDPLFETASLYKK